MTKRGKYLERQLDYALDEVKRIEGKNPLLKESLEEIKRENELPTKHLTQKGT